MKRMANMNFRDLKNKVALGGNFDYFGVTVPRETGEKLVEHFARLGTKDNDLIVLTPEEVTTYLGACDTIDLLHLKMDMLSDSIRSLEGFKERIEVGKIATDAQKETAKALAMLSETDRNMLLKIKTEKERHILTVLMTDAPDKEYYMNLRVSYFEMVDALETLRSDMGGFKRPFTRAKKTDEEPITIGETTEKVVTRTGKMIEKGINARMPKVEQENTSESSD
jgi:hypothetical protein